MLDSCNTAARLLLLSAHDQACVMRHDWLGTEHVVLAEIATEVMEGSGLLISHGVSMSSARQMLQELLPSRDISDLDAVRVIDIDSHALRQAVRREHHTELHIAASSAGANSGSDSEWWLPLTARMQRISDRARPPRNQQAVEPKDLWAALLDESTGLGVIVLEHLGVPMDNLRPSDLAAKTLPLTRLKQRHVRLAFPDGTAVDATGFTTEIGPNPPMWGLYMYELWQPSWPYRFVAWPDFGVPDDQQDADFEVGCRGGVGRTGTVLSCMASLAGVPPTDAVSRVREHYASRAVDNSIQEARILGFARRHPR
jgi:hypothetical protein